MNTAIIDLQYLPDITWFKKYITYKTVFIEQHENFVKSTNRNRCAIAGPNGKQILSIPLDGGRDHRQAYTQVPIAYTQSWQSAHWHAIQTAYGSTPFFEHYAYRLHPFYQQPYPLLFNYNLQLLQVVIKMLKLDTQLHFTETYTKQPEGIADLRSGRGAQPDVALPVYYQVFDNKNGFISNLSIIDLIFHVGPQAKDYLMNLNHVDRQI